MRADFHIIDDTHDEPPTKHATDEDRLNLGRIRAVALDRRSAYRRVMWVRVLAVGFSCLAIKTAVDAMRIEDQRRWWFAAGSIVFMLLAARAIRRAGRLVPSKDRTVEPTPDAGAFETLSNGSQYSKHLDDFRS